MFTTDSKYSQPTRYVYTVRQHVQKARNILSPSRGKLKDRAEKKAWRAGRWQGFLVS
jgi:hypothetical protein